MFQNVNIDVTSMQKKLPDFDARSTVTSKSLKGSNMTKKDKRKLKHDMWMKSKGSNRILRMMGGGSGQFKIEKHE